MRLTRLHIGRMPGIDSPIDLAALGPATNVVIGPNASGKSSLVRAVRALLYPETEPSPEIVAEAELEDGEVRYDVARVGSAVAWRRDGVQAPRPTLVDERFLGLYTLRVEDLMATGRTDEEIARSIARAMAGGYDLADARRPFALKSNHGKAERGTRDEAHERLKTTQRRLDELRADERRLETLEARRVRAREAAHSLARYDTALELVGVLRRRAERRAEAETFRPDLDALDGGERDRLDDLEEKLAAEREHGRDAAERERRAEERLASTGLDGADLDATALKAWSKRVTRLAATEADADAAARELDGAEATLALARRDLGGGDPEFPPDLTPTTLASLEEHLEARRLALAKVRAVEARLALLAGDDPDEAALASARKARDTLLAWLATPEPPVGAPAARAPLLLATAAAAVAVYVAATTAHLAWSALLLPLLVGVALAWTAGRRAAAAADDPRARLRATFEDLGAPGPAAWDPPAVRSRLDALDVEIQELQAARARAHDRTTLRVDADAARDELAAVEARLADLAERLGFEPRGLDGSFHLWAQRLLAHDEARREVEASRGRLAGLRDAIAEEAGAVAAFLDRFGAAPEGPAPDAETLGTYLERLEARVGERDDALHARAAAEKDAADAETRAAEARAGVAKLLRKAGLDPADEDAAAELDARLAQLDAWNEHRQNVRDDEARIRAGEAALAGRDDLLAAARALREDELRQERDARAEESEGYEALVGTIKEIEAALKEAKESRSLEHDLARLREAEDALQERLDEACYAAAGELLLDAVEEEYAHASRPPALKRATSWFASFTHHAFELVFDDGAFAAHDTASGRRLGLDELSTGTRAQLLLAVRVAFTDGVEDRLPRLPLFLDEALTTSDGGRFAAVASSLAQLAETSDRQVFYLSARPEDAAPWLAATRDRDAGCEVIDLAHERRLGRDPIDPSRLALPERPAVPSPDGHTPASYAETLRVPPIDLWGGADAVHVFHLLRDDLSLLHRVLELGAERLGTLRSRLGSPGVDAHLGAAACVRLRRRIRAAEAWMRARAIGHGRPVTRAVLERSGAVSDTFIDPVTDLMHEVDGDGRAILDGLAAKAVPGFWTNKREELEAYFEDHGHVPREPALSDEALRARAYSAYLEAGGAAPQEAHRDVTFLCDALGVGFGDAAASPVGFEGTDDAGPVDEHHVPASD